MSGATNPTVRQERDSMSHVPVYAFAFFLVLTLGVGAVLTWLIERHQPVHVGLERETSGLVEAPREIDMVDQTLFSAHLPSRGDWTQKQQELDSYVWVDRDRRIVRIPVQRAMQMLVERGHVE